MYIFYNVYILQSRHFTARFFWTVFNSTIALLIFVLNQLQHLSLLVLLQWIYYLNLLLEFLPLFLFINLPIN